MNSGSSPGAAERERRPGSERKGRRHGSRGIHRFPSLRASARRGFRSPRRRRLHRLLQPGAKTAAISRPAPGDPGSRSPRRISRRATSRGSSTAPGAYFISRPRRACGRAGGGNSRATSNRTSSRRSVSSRRSRRVPRFRSSTRARAPCTARRARSRCGRITRRSP